MGISFTSNLSQVRNSSFTGVQAVCCVLAGGICRLCLLASCISGGLWLTLPGLKEVTVKPGEEMGGIFLQSVLCSAQAPVFGGLAELFANPGDDKPGTLL